MKPLLNYNDIVTIQYYTNTKHEWNLKQLRKFKCINTNSLSFKDKTNIMNYLQIKYDFNENDFQLTNIIINDIYEHFNFLYDQKKIWKYIDSIIPMYFDQ